MFAWHSWIYSDSDEIQQFNSATYRKEGNRNPTIITVFRQLKASNYEVSTMNYFSYELFNNNAIINILLVHIIEYNAS